MKIARFAIAAGERLGLIVEDGVVDLTRRLAGSPVDSISLLERWNLWADELRALATASADHLLADVKLLAPIARPGKILAVGMNYADHVAEIGADMPERQLWFMKPGSSVNDPSGRIEMPLASIQLDYEVELVIVIGNRVRNIDEAAAPDAIFGYCVGNDISVRDRQFETSQFLIGKGGDGHAPIGPWITTRDEARIEDAEIKSFVNGELRQSSSTGQLIFGCEALVSHISRVMTLDPGDVIFTGTPAGVALGFDPPRWLRAGDTVRVEIDGLGGFENEVVDFAPR